MPLIPSFSAEVEFSVQSTQSRVFFFGIECLCPWFSLRQHYYDCDYEIKDRDHRIENEDKGEMRQRRRQRVFDQDLEVVEEA